MPPEPREIPRRYTRQEKERTLLMFGACLVTQAFFLYLLPPSSVVYPATAVALVMLFFEGLRLWPGIFVAFLVANVFMGVESPLVYLLPVAQTVTAVGGAHFLRKTAIDPLFRRYRDTFYVIVTILLVSLIIPTTFLLLPEAALVEWHWFYGYIATVFSLLVGSPFLLRWLAKLRFRRPAREAIETVMIFAVLIGVNSALFSFNIVQVFGVPLVYLLLIPFFWIAIHLRPRFVTLAIVITSIFALHDVMTSSPPQTLTADLFTAELFLIALAMAFYIIVSLEEDRRAHTNLVRSQIATLENALSRISSESQAKNDFIAILAHELRNPLAPVVSAIEFMKLKGTKDPEIAESLEVMETSMQTVRRLLDDLLDISRIAEGKLTLKRKVLDLREIVERAMVSTEHYYTERHQSLIFAESKAPLHIEGDPVRLEQIFSNLLTNASKYSPSGSTVKIKLAAEDGMAEVTILDKGIGIARDAIDTIFLPFHQLEKSKQSKKGLGIGLALVRSFVEMHDGSITAASGGEGRGSAFTVRLPLATDKPGVSNKPSAPIKLPKKRGPSVLVVDDNDAAAAGIGRLLELWGCTVAYAYDGNQALEKAEEFSFKVIILDIGMQDQDGYTVARKLRTQGCDALLIALSGYSTQDSRERGKSAGFDHYLVKPAGLAELRAVIPGLG